MAVARWRKDAVSVASVTWIMTPAGRSSAPRIAHTAYDQYTGRCCAWRCSCSGRCSGTPVRNTRSRSGVRHPPPAPSGTASANGRPVSSAGPFPASRANAGLT